MPLCLSIKLTTKIIDIHLIFPQDSPNTSIHIITDNFKMLLFKSQ